MRTWVVGQGTLFSSKCSREMHVCVIPSVFNPQMSILGILRFTFSVNICFFAFFGKIFMYFNAGKVLQYFFYGTFPPRRRRHATCSPTRCSGGERRWLLVMCGWSRRKVENGDGVAFSFGWVEGVGVHDVIGLLACSTSWLAY